MSQNIKETSSFSFYILSFIGLVALLGSTMAKNPTLPLFATNLGANESQIGVIAAIGPIPGILLSAPSGAIADRIGKLRIIRISLLFFASAPFLYLFVTEPWQLIPIRFYHGLATAVFGPVVLSLIASMYTTEKAVKISLYSSISMIGRILAPLLGGILIGMGSYLMVYLVCGLSGLLALILGFTVRGVEIIPEKNNISSSFTSIPSDLWKIIQNPGIFITSLMEAVQFFSIGAVEVFLPLQMESFGWDPILIGFIMSIQIGALILLKPFMGSLSDRWQRKPLIIIGLLNCGVSLVLFGLLTDFFIYSLGSLIFGIGISLTTASSAALVSDFSIKAEYGSSIGILSSIMDIGHSLGPLLCGIMISMIGFSTAYLVVAGLIISAILVFYLGVHPLPFSHD